MKVETEETKLKVGDILVCHSVVVMNDSDGTDIRTTVGKSYKIIKIVGNKLAIINDDNGEHHFYFDNYNKWFYNLKEERRNKLKKIQDAESW